ncbi:hypothetical protein J1N35_001684 [Gossypium stocksii]|uniref:Aminotransferase-like plant mobile domain-containing protein n=1 Tax=Gossypium stocksii TaxID=47602 RepID=A0A9D4ALK8_9ROSI|nr:hypothetical protein J1N35_001684 [Gossypium stocksii]
MARLINKDPHISNTANNMVNGLGYSPDDRLMPYLKQVGFRSPITGVSVIAELAALCYSLLGASPDDDESNFSGLKFTWLKANFEHLSANATKEELMCAAQAFIMHIIGGVLMPNANNNKVHLQYLPLLADLSNIRSYSWGSAVLAMLYRELCRTIKPATVDIGRCLILLQSWALYWMSFLSSGTMGIEYYDSLVASNISRICQRRQSTVVHLHMQRPGAYEPVADIEAEPEADCNPKPNPEPKSEPHPKPERSHSHLDSHSYHPNLPVFLLSVAISSLS